MNLAIYVKKKNHLFYMQTLYIESVNCLIAD
jgi:hypothetical protein